MVSPLEIEINSCYSCYTCRIASIQKLLIYNLYMLIRFSANLKMLWRCMLQWSPRSRALHPNSCSGLHKAETKYQTTPTYFFAAAIIPSRYYLNRRLYFIREVRERERKKERERERICACVSVYAYVRVCDGECVRVKIFNEALSFPTIRNSIG